MPCYTAAQTAIKMLYWSLLVYDHGEQRASPVTADTALLLYDLEHFEVFWEKSLDTKAVVGWNSDMVGGGAGGGCGRKGEEAERRLGLLAAASPALPLQTPRCLLLTRLVHHAGPAVLASSPAPPPCCLNLLPPHCRW
jgi:hypothetical protein